MTDAAHAALSAHIARIRTLPALAKRVLPKVAREVARETEAQIARGESPDGQPWQPTKDGRTPLRGAARAVRVAVEGGSIVVSVEGYHALHHMGRARGGVRRQIIPREMSTRLARVISSVASEEFNAIMGRR